MYGRNYRKKGKTSAEVADELEERKWCEEFSKTNKIIRSTNLYDGHVICIREFLLSAFLDDIDGSNVDTENGLGGYVYNNNSCSRFIQRNREVQSVFNLLTSCYSEDTNKTLIVVSGENIDNWKLVVNRLHRFPNHEYKIVRRRALIEEWFKLFFYVAKKYTENKEWEDECYRLSFENKEEFMKGFKKVLNIEFSKKCAWPVTEEYFIPLGEVIGSPLEILDEQYTLVIFDGNEGREEINEFLLAAAGFLQTDRRLVYLNSKAHIEGSKEEWMSYETYFNSIVLSASKDKEIFKYLEEKNESMIRSYALRTFINEHHYISHVSNRLRLFNENTYCEYLREFIEKKRQEKIEDTEQGEVMLEGVEDMEVGDEDKESQSKDNSLRVIYGIHPSKDRWMLEKYQKECCFEMAYAFASPTCEEMYELRNMQISAENNEIPTVGDMLAWFSSTNRLEHSKMKFLNLCLNNITQTRHEDCKVFFVISSYMEHIFKTSTHPHEVGMETHEYLEYRESDCMHCQELKTLGLDGIKKFNFVKDRVGYKSDKKFINTVTFTDILESGLYKVNNIVFVMLDAYSYEENSDINVLSKIISKMKKAQDGEDMMTKPTFVWCATANTIEERKCRMLSCWMYNCCLSSFPIKNIYSYKYRKNEKSMYKIAGDTFVSLEKTSDCISSYTKYLAGYQISRKIEGAPSVDIIMNDVISMRDIGRKLYLKFINHVSEKLQKEISSFLHRKQKSNPIYREIRELQAELASVSSNIGTKPYTNNMNKINGPRRELAKNYKIGELLNHLLYKIRQGIECDQKEFSYERLYEKVTIFLTLKETKGKFIDKIQLDPMLLQFFGTEVITGEMKKMINFPPVSYKILSGLLCIMKYQSEKLTKERNNNSSDIDEDEAGPAQTQPMIVYVKEHAESEYATSHLTVPTACLLAMCVSRAPYAYLRYDIGVSGRKTQYWDTADFSDSEEEPSFFYAVNNKVVCFFGPKAVTYFQEYLENYRKTYNILTLPSYAIAIADKYYLSYKLHLVPIKSVFSCGDYNWKVFKVAIIDY